MINPQAQVEILVPQQENQIIKQNNNNQNIEKNIFRTIIYK